MLVIVRADVHEHTAPSVLKDIAHDPLSAFPTMGGTVLSASLLQHGLGRVPAQIGLDESSGEDGSASFTGMERGGSNSGDGRNHRADESRRSRRVPFNKGPRFE